jgi:disulfide bond formation protein DsbB
MQGCVKKYLNIFRNPSCRLLYVLGFSYCAGIIVLAYLLEYIYQLEPCSLCLLQRVVIATVGGLFMLGAIINCKNIFGYFLSSLLFIVNGCGIFLAGRQVWLQSLPADLVPSCSAGIVRLMEVYPLLKVLSMVISGTGECAKVEFEIFGLSIAALSLINFICLEAFIFLVIYWQKKGGLYNPPF